MSIHTEIEEMIREELDRRYSEQAVMYTIDYQVKRRIDSLVNLILIWAHNEKGHVFEDHPEHGHKSKCRECGMEIDKLTFQESMSKLMGHFAGYLSEDFNRTTKLPWVLSDEEGADG